MLIQQIQNLFQSEFAEQFVSPQSNNAYKKASLLGTIPVSNKGGAFLMPNQKLTIVPVTLHAKNKDGQPSVSPTSPNNSCVCTLKTTKAEISGSIIFGVGEYKPAPIFLNKKNETVTKLW